MRLFFNQTSPYARKTRIAVREFGLEQQVTCIEIDPWAEPDELTTVNPLSKVPALQLPDGSVVTESDAIVAALLGRSANTSIVEDEASPNARRSRAALCQGLIDASFGSVIERRRPVQSQWADWVARQERAVSRTLSTVEATFDLPMERFDAGDISLACALGYLDFRLPHLSWRSARPRLETWFAKVDQRPSMIATRPC